MQLFTKYTGIVLPLDIANIDTDNIIPKQFLQETTRINFGKYLFFNWRFIEYTSMIPNPHFVLNNPKYKNASILLTRKNFGCGSSREHAVWALIDYGFKAIIASSFSDIFYKNSFNNRLLLIKLSEPEIDLLFKNINTYKQNMFITIDLKNKTISENQKKYLFEIQDSYQKYILNNIDKISLTLQYSSMIQEYEKNRPIYLQ